jgi:protease IV
MKNFLTSMLGALVALVIFAAGTALLFVGFLVAIAAMGSNAQKTPAVEKNAYLVFDLDVNLTDRPPQFDLAAIMGALTGGGEEPKTLQLRQVTHALRKAAKDGNIAGMFIHGQFSPEGYGTGFAALKELRAALLDFKASGKPLVAHVDFATLREAYVVATASELIVDPYGLIFMPGLASQPVYLAGAFEKYGIGVQVTRVGKFKSAIEPFTRRDMSPESREQMQKLLDDLWGDMRADIAKDRDLTPEVLQALVDKEGILRADVALSSKVATRVAYRDEVIADLKRRTGVNDPEKTFRQVTLAEYVKNNPAERPGVVLVEAGGKSKKGGSGTIAVIYAEGAIVDGKGEPGEVGGESFARALRRLRQDDDIKGIVLRVNSPGGSASASEHIQREIRLARKEMPVAVSMGTYAASGGYWISTYAERIFAEPTTITGSIGVFGIQMNVQQLAGNLGITFDRVKTGKFADSATIARPKTDEELAILQRMVDWIYEEFVGKVAESRNLPRERVHEIAQGRVWSGTEAVKLGLVDELGGLDAALSYVAEKAGLGDDYEVEEFPRKKDLNDLIAEAFKDFAPAGTKAPGAVTQLVDRMKLELKTLEQFNDPRGIYARLPLEFSVQ